MESPNAEPPRVRPPPYSFAPIDCKEDFSRSPSSSSHYNTAIFNLCGDLNKGTIPRNPMGQNVLGSPYPLINSYEQSNNNLDRFKRSLNNATTTTTTTTAASVKSSKSPQITRQSRKFCDQGGIFCTLYNVINGEPSTINTPIHAAQHLPIERRDDAVPINNNNNNNNQRYEGPPTPCPAKVEYATPVFAKNYQGTWRYVVQIPHEGYFTQTVEITRCLQTRCHYLDGGCLASPRWSSLLVAEIYYPDAILTTGDVNNPQRSPVSGSQPPSVQDFQKFQQYLQKRAGVQPNDEFTTTKPAHSHHCDGIDALGCFQVRLYYDWFLIPNSCKCWRPDYFNKYVRRKSNFAAAAAGTDI